MIGKDRKDFSTYNSKAPLKDERLSFSYLHLGVSCDGYIGIWAPRGVVDIQLSIGWANHLKQKDRVWRTPGNRGLPASARGSLARPGL